MSEQETKTVVPPGSGGSSVVVVEQSSASRHKYKPAELDEPEAHNKRTRAPGVPSVVEDLKDSNDNRQSCNPDTDLASEKLRQSVVKALSSTGKKKGMAQESITLSPLEVESKRGGTTSPQPIPAQPDTLSSAENLAAGKIATSNERAEADEDSIKEELGELRSPESSKKTTEWSDDEEAGGLPRSESRSSRVSRGLRQLFCCGAAYEAPSEEDISARRWSAI